MRARLGGIIKKPVLRYLMVGSAAVIAEYGSFLLLYALLPSWLWFDNGFSFCFGLATSFLLNRLWVFNLRERSYDKRIAHQFAFYVTLSLANLLLTLLVVGYLKYIGIDPRIGKLLAMGLTSAWNFILFKLFIFNHQNL